MIYSKRKINNILLWLFPFIAFEGLGLMIFPQKIFAYVLNITFPIMTLYVWSELKLQKQNIYFNCMRYLLMATGIGALMSIVLWEQTFFEAYISLVSRTKGGWVILFFFFLKAARITTEELKRFIWINLFIYAVVYFYVLHNLPVPTLWNQISDDEVNMDDSRGIIRISVANRGVLPLALFLAINSWNTTKEKKYLAISFIIVVLIFMLVTRQIIFLSLLCGLYYLIMYKKRMWIYLIALACILYFGISNIKFSDDSIIGSLVNLTEEQLNGETQQSYKGEDIRVTEYKYFFTKYNDNPLAIMFGNGNPGGHSKLYWYENRLRTQYGIYRSDVGYARIFVTFGLCGLLVFIILHFKAIMQRVSPQCQWVRIYMIYMIFANIAASWYFSDGIWYSVAVYILAYHSKTNQLKKDNEIFNINSSL